MSEAIYFCAVTDFSALRGGKRGWPEMPVYYHTSGPAGHVSAQDFRAITVYALEDIQDNCGAVFLYTPNIKTANVVMSGKAIDGRGKVLAQSMLPVGLSRNSDMVVEQEYDSEIWSSEELAPEGKISMPAVIRHEWGHGGAAIEHAPDNSGALMRPMLEHGVSKLQAWDIKAWQAIYGPSKRNVPPPTQPNPPSPFDDVLEIRIQGGNVQIKRNGVLQRLSPSPFNGG